ncbi:ABC transporter permease [uncultured Sphingomonas sp.]|uniref:MlaE family ABC transporter permease n=1 Tax=uncultured Sphingomonas sp. TaxID=158754 RepID=UPI0025F873F9|nr:ABC transporter permease [uncultured Sphingomonas sp.]
MKDADFAIAGVDERRSLQPTGDWTALCLGEAERRLEQELGGQKVGHLDIAALGRVDTSGALILLRCLENPAAFDAGERDDLKRLIEIVQPALADTDEPVRGKGGIMAFLDRFGRQVVTIGLDIYHMLEFAGQLMIALMRTIGNPRKLRTVPLVAMMQEAGINAIPIVFVMTFFIGAVIALVGTSLLTTLGMEIFTVQLVGIAVLREFGVVIASILLAGRSASAFAAQIGSMRMNQETDAMQVMGVDRFDALVIPRILAALAMMPILTFCADIGGIVGGIIVSWLTMDINPVLFIHRMLDTVALRHFWIGMSKAPFLALVIAAAGCRHGMMVGGDVQSLGRHVTSAVVQSVFMLIMFDAIFAILFMVLDL